MHVLYNTSASSSPPAQFSYMYLYELPTHTVLHTHNTHIDYVIHVSYITVAIADEHLTIRERTSSSPLLVYYTSLTSVYIHTTVHMQRAIAYASMRFVAEEIFWNITARNFHHWSPVIFTLFLII